MLKLKLSELKKLEWNPRTIKKEDLDKLTKSIEKFWIIEWRPFLVSNRTWENVIIWGNQRYEVCKKLGIKEVPVHIMEWLSEEEEKEIIIRDNISNGEWDWDILANEWDQEELEEWGLDVQFETVEPEAQEDDFEVDEGIQTDIVLGDLFEIWPHRLLCGDSTDSDQVAKLMNRQKADMVFTDPPYGMFLETNLSNNINWSKDGWKGKSKNYSNVIGDHDDFSEELINTIFSHFTDTKEVFIWGADYFAELIPNKNDGSWFVWNKTRNNEENEQIKSNGSQFELCWSKNKHKRIVVNVLWKGLMGTESQDIRSRVHPTQKPIQICDFFIKEYSNENNIIVDLYFGSGSTMVAAHQLKRKCYGMELDPKYVQTIINRMIKLDSTLEIKRNWIHYKPVISE